MPPRRWIWLFGFVLAAAAAVSGSIQLYVTMRGHDHSFGKILLWELCCWGFWAAVAPVLVAAGARFADPVRRRSREWPLIIAVGIALIAAHITCDAAVILAVQPFLPIERFDFATAFVEEAKSTWMFDILACAIPTLAGYGAAAYDRAQRLVLRESRLEADLARAQLDALRLEIEPHFLFNTLNSIASLIRTDASDRALSMLLGLSELMRSTLHDSGPTTALEAELAFVRKYVELQRVRFADRLQVKYTVEAAAEQCEVPTFLLQPLVENAFRHGIARRPGACTLEISASLDADRLHIHIRDDGAGLPPAFDLAADGGVGLRNTQLRLQRGYGAAASLSLERRVAGGTEVAIALPVTRAVAMIEAAV